MSELPWYRTNEDGGAMSSPKSEVVERVQMFVLVAFRWISMLDDGEKGERMPAGMKLCKESSRAKPVCASQ